MRSLLFVPGDSQRKLEKSLASQADVVILDLEDSVSVASKDDARETTAAFLNEARQESVGMRFFVRVNDLQSGLIDDDLAAIIPAAPDGIMLPKSESGTDLEALHVKLDVAEASAGLEDGATRVLLVATETAASIFGLGTYVGRSARLEGLAWGGEDLSADIGATANRSGGSFTEPFRLARNLCLFGAVAANVAPIDTVYTNFKDPEGLENECRAAARDGFTAKMAIHPAQVEIINTVFTPAPADVERAHRIVDAFAAPDAAGVIGLDGEMLDRPHLKRAHRILARAGLSPE